jgi:tetratricopeptide (TPR) repeat protein
MKYAFLALLRGRLLFPGRVAFKRKALCTLLALGVISVLISSSMSETPPKTSTPTPALDSLEKQKKAQSEFTPSINKPESYLVLARMLKAQWRLAEAEKAYAQFYHLMPGGGFVPLPPSDHPPIILSKEEIKGQDFKAAIKIRKKDVQLKPEDPDALENLAILLDFASRRKEAKKYWEKALKAETNEKWIGRIKKRLAEPD